MATLKQLFDFFENQGKKLKKQNTDSYATRYDNFDSLYNALDASANITACTNAYFSLIYPAANKAMQEDLRRIWLHEQCVPILGFSALLILQFVAASLLKATSDIEKKTRQQHPLNIDREKLESLVLAKLEGSNWLIYAFRMKLASPLRAIARIEEKAKRLYILDQERYVRDHLKWHEYLIYKLGIRSIDPLPFIKDSQPYVRDVLKGMTYASRGLKNLANINKIYPLASQNLVANSLFPATCVFALFAAANKMLIRYIIEQRKNITDSNAKLLNWKLDGRYEYEHEGKRYRFYFEAKDRANNIDHIRAWEAQTTWLGDSGGPYYLGENNEKVYLKDVEFLEENLKQIKNIDFSLSAAGYTTALLGGIVDGLYNYLGILLIVNLTAVSPVFIQFALAVSFAFLVLSVVVRVFDDHNFQKKIRIQVAKDKLLDNQIVAVLVPLRELLENLDLQLEAGIEYSSLEEERARLIYEVETAFKKLKRALDQPLFQRSRFQALLEGARYGLAFYIALSTLLFACAAFNTIFTGALFIPAMAIPIVLTLGLLTVIASATYMYFLPQAREQELSFFIREFTKLDEFKSMIYKDDPQVIQEASAKCSGVQNTLQEHSRRLYDAQGQNLFLAQESADALRSLFSGASKGYKVLSSFLSIIAGASGQNEYASSHPWVIPTAAIGAGAVFGANFFGRSLGKNLGSSPKDLIAASPERARDAIAKATDQYTARKRYGLFGAPSRELYMPPRSAVIAVPVV